MKKLGKSNDDIPADEMLLAKIIQNSKAKNLKWCKGAEYRDVDGRSVAWFNTEPASCCAMGAIKLADDTLSEWHKKHHHYGLVTYGNDLVDWVLWIDDFTDQGETMGYAYAKACRDDD